MPARQLRIQLATIGLQGMARLAWQNRTGAQLRAYEICRPLLEGRRGLEIGGPSAIFSRTGSLPLYPLFDRLDNCDFASDTVWHGEAADGAEFTYDEERPPGRRLIRDATSLDGIEDASYDVVLASHTLEHIANPLLALSEWRRVVGADGHLVLVLPHLENTFDHRRPVTTLEHIEADFAALDPRRRPDARQGVHRALRPATRPRPAVARGIRATHPRPHGESDGAPPRLRHRPRRAAARPRGLSAPLGRDRAAVSHRRSSLERTSRSRTTATSWLQRPPGDGRASSAATAVSSPVRGRKQTRASRRPPASSTSGRPRPDTRRARPEARQAARPRAGARARASHPV